MRPGNAKNSSSRPSARVARVGAVTNSNPNRPRRFCGQATGSHHGTATAKEAV
ncbi:hypothetical protein I553_2521 [Mycobacterium xenopi 4042]|uniref:Uncharacterized protein n=1 Tax=Mycobacterium xenopi 4042 TaxID=1299334 RepID=X8CAJ2_MYCXE|nr:hypothetical protein I552_6840 [Mycobacterium xenopi 3993]EUA52335.1 hypothetical protein I553_2521 [Mycobacterium xenopi 4042]